MSDSLPVICNWQSPWSEKESCHCLPDNTYWFLSLHTNQTCHLISFLLNLSKCVGSLIGTWNSYSNIPIPTIPTNGRASLAFPFKQSIPTSKCSVGGGQTWDKRSFFQTRWQIDEYSHVVKALKYFLHWSKKTRAFLFHHLIFLFVCLNWKRTILSLCLIWLLIRYRARMNFCHLCLF